MLSNPITLYYCTGNCFCFGLLVGLWGCRNLTLKTIWSLVPFAIFCLCIFAHCFMFVCCNCLFAFWIKVQFRRRHRSSDKVALLMSYHRVGKVACTFSSFSSARIQICTTPNLKYTKQIHQNTDAHNTQLQMHHIYKSTQKNTDFHSTLPQIHNTNTIHPPQYRFTQQSTSNA